jgi:outer membrane beta-barrel protein
MRFMSKWISFSTASLLAVGVTLVHTAPAQAQERKSPLADAPAIRKRVELRDKRFEIGVGGGTSLGQDFYHAVMISGRLGFHFTDWLSLGAWGGFNVTPKFTTSFHERLMEVLPENGDGGRTPSRAQALAGMNRIGQAFAVQAELLPFAGKFGLFSKLFMNYDFYAFGGPGFVNFAADTTCAGADQPSCAVTGLKIGANFGVGAHLFTNNFFALNLELRDLLVRNNPAGRDETGDGVADSRDLTWDSNYILSLNLTFFLPATAPISN